MDELRGLREQMELSTTMQPRFRAVLVQSVLITVVSAAAAVVDRAGIYSPGHGAHIGACIGFFALAAITTARLGPEVRAHMSTRQLTTGAQFVGAGLVLMAVFGAVIDIPVGQAVGADMLLVATAMATLSVIGEKFVIGVAAWLAVGAFLCAAWPAHFLWVIAGLNVVLPAILLVGMRLTTSRAAA